MNGDSWKIRFVRRDDPRLVDRTGTLSVATTDPETFTICLSEELTGDFLITVLIHELGHCALYSFGLLTRIQRMVKPRYRVEMEEFICNFLADFGFQIFQIAFGKMGYDAWKLIPQALEQKIA